MAQLIKHSLCKQEELSSIPGTQGKSWAWQPIAVNSVLGGQRQAGLWALLVPACCDSYDNCRLTESRVTWEMDH